MKKIFVVGEESFLKEDLKDGDPSSFQRFHSLNDQKARDRISQCIKGNSPPIIIVQSIKPKEIISWMKSLRRTYAEVLLPRVLAINNDRGQKNKLNLKDERIIFVSEMEIKDFLPVYK